MRLQGNFVTNADPALNLSASDFVFDYSSDNDANDADATANVYYDSSTTRNGVIGSNSNDTITAIGSEEVVALGGDDIIIARSGGGRTEMRGGAGNDVFLFGDQAGIINHIGNEGNDTIVAGTTGQVSYYGNSGDDLIIGNYTGGGVQRAGAGNDTLYGGRGNDNYLEGGSGNDYINAGEGNDTHRTSGGAGDDTIIGGYGQDILWGGNYASYAGSGTDTFIFYDPLESDSAAADRIYSFNEGDDSIQLYGFTGIGVGLTEVTITTI